MGTNLLESAIIEFWVTKSQNFSRSTPFTKLAIVLNQIFIVRRYIIEKDEMKQIRRHHAQSYEPCVKKKLRQIRHLLPVWLILRIIITCKGT